MTSGLFISTKDARAVLGVAADATASELRRAFRDAAKLAHPDRPGGDAQQFRTVVEAYHRLSAPPPRSLFQPPAVRTPDIATLRIGPQIACRGGVIEHVSAHGAALRIALPPGLRTGDVVRAAGVELSVLLCGGDGVLVRGDDLWMSLDVAPDLLAHGGAVGMETPHGARVLKIAPGASGLARVRGAGLPARGEHPRGDLFVRLVALAPAQDSASLLRRFTRAWAA